jgi:hypothetical protein
MESERYKIKVIGHTKKEGHMHYIISVEKNGQNFSFTERYSGLRGLNEALRKSTNKLTFPKFPPKKFFGSEEEKFIIKRQQEINTYFELICKDQDLVTLPPLIKFIEDKRSKQNLNDKSDQIKKENIKVEEKELKKSLKNPSEKDYEKIVKDLKDKFYNMNNMIYDKENLNDNDSGKFVKYFKNNKINFVDFDIKLENGDENNFKYINNEDENDLKYSEDKIKDKFRKMDELIQSFDDIYNTNGILVPI